MYKYIVKFPIITSTIAYVLGIFVSSNIVYTDIEIDIMVTSILFLSIIYLEKNVKHREYLKTYYIITSIIIMSSLFNSTRVNYPQIEGSILTEITIIRNFNSTDRYQNCIVKDNLNNKRYFSRLKKEDSIFYEIGSTFIIEADIEPINNIVIPNNFDFNRYLDIKGIKSKLIISDYIHIDNHLLVRVVLEEKIDNSNLSTSSKGLMKALVLGNKSDIPEDLLLSFSDSGIMHLLALSGLHIGVLSLILTFLLRPLKRLNRGKLIRSIVVVILLWGYAYITGFSSSIIRATIMFSVIVIGTGMRREINIYNSLAIAALTLLIIDPNYIYDVGFQLSFSAVIGIVWMFPILSKFWEPKSVILKYIWDLFIVSVSAQAATLPFTIYYFHKFSGLFFIANIIEIPLITVLLALSYAIMTLLIYGVEYRILVYIYNKTVIFIQFVSDEISSFDSMVFRDLFLTRIEVFLLVILVSSIVYFVRYRKSIYLFLILFITLLIQGVTLLGKWDTSNLNRLMIAKDDIYIQQNGMYSYNTSSNRNVFYNYSMANNIILKDTIIEDVFIFNDEVFWKVNKITSKNIINENHTIIIDNSIKTNPNIITNEYTKRVVYTGYSSSVYKDRWELYCEKNNIIFYNSTNDLFSVEHVNY